MHPFRGTIYFTTAAADIDAASDAYDDVVNFLEANGYNFEGGSLDVMQREDVVKDSPLDRAAR